MEDVKSSRRLLILSCSQSKIQGSTLLPALARYDGPKFRLVRKFQRDCVAEASLLDIYVLSAKYGLIPASKPIQFYDRRLSHARIAVLMSKVRISLKSIFDCKTYSHIFLCMGRDYHALLRGIEHMVDPSVALFRSKATQGRMLSELYDWLRGSSPRLHDVRESGSMQKKVVIRGTEVSISPHEVNSIARQALITSNGAHKHLSWFVPVDDEHVAPKWLVSQITGLSVSKFVTSEALRFLAQVGVEIHRA